MKKAGKIISNLLLAFVLISIGFALGKHRAVGPDATPAVPPSIKMAEAVNVYYMHATFRCVTCNTIEKMTKQLLESSYSREMQNGQIKFSEVNFQKNEKLAKQFDVLSSCVVVARTKDGRIIEFERLDKVWELMSAPGEFNAYISSAINKFMARNSGGAK